MPPKILATQLVEFGIEKNLAENYAQRINTYLAAMEPPVAWQKISREILQMRDPFALHYWLYCWCRQESKQALFPAWIPTTRESTGSNVARILQKLKWNSYQELQHWSQENYREFWALMLEQLHIVFHKKPVKVCDDYPLVEKPNWLTGAKFNIAESCFTADPHLTAIVAQAENGMLIRWTYRELESLTNQVANSLVKAGYKPGDAIAIDMVMTAEAVAIYLGIIKAGCVVVGIADSFAPEEIHTRLALANAKAIFTQDSILRGGKRLPLYEKIVAAEAPRAIVLATDTETTTTLNLRPGDMWWEYFLSSNDEFTAVSRKPDDHINILFSSGTTGEPKAIPWTQTTPIKSASDGYLHTDIQPGNVIAWPTNLGWMMGPWLIFAGLINHGTLALYYGAPTGNEFGQFVQNARVNILGVVPSIVNTWRATQCMENLDWRCIKLFASTGESSNAEDMFYLMWLANYRPIIEYCGGTEIGGAYITSTVLQPCVPATFTTPALGLNFVIIDEHGKPTTNGEVALIPPSIGLSEELLNRDHHKTYFDGMPQGPNRKILRRHGDQIEYLAQNYYHALGRVDDTMNLGGIKTSSAEIERTLNVIPEINETAAIAISPKGGGPSLLVIYTVLNSTEKKPATDELKKTMQQLVKQHLNPLFKIHEVMIVEMLPRTPSNKVMRRVLRAEYEKSNQ